MGHIHMFSGLVPSLNANGRALHRGQAYQAVVGEDDDLLSFESANNLRDSGAPTIESSQNTPAPRVEPAPAPSGAVTAADPKRPSSWTSAARWSHPRTLKPTKSSRSSGQPYHKLRGNSTAESPW